MSDLVDELLGVAEGERDGEPRPKKVCPACGRSTAYAGAACLCGHRLREPPERVKREAVLGESVLDELELTEADVAEAIGTRSPRPARPGEGDLGRWVAYLREMGHDWPKVTEITATSERDARRAYRLVGGRG